MKTKIHIVLPAYNEELSLQRLLKRLDFAIQDSNLLAEITVVNDGSTDNTIFAVKSFLGVTPIKIIDQKLNKGLAETIKNGLFTVLKDCNDEDIIIVMDADNSHTPGLMLRMVNLILEAYRFDLKDLKLTMTRVNLYDVIENCFEQLLEKAKKENADIVCPGLQ